MSNTEIWKAVPSKPGIMASSWGRIRLNPRCYPMPNGAMRSTKPRPRYGCKTKAGKTARHTYFGLVTKEHGNMKVHRLVCEAFHGAAPFANAVVIHLNENGLDNRSENLRWGTQKENLNMPGFVAYCRSRIGDKSPVTKSRKSRKTQETETKF
jgi:hypothetical protein